MSDDRQLGMDRSISRRDFLNGVAVGVGGALAAGALPDAFVKAAALERAIQGAVRRGHRSGASRRRGAVRKKVSDEHYEAR